MSFDYRLMLVKCITLLYRESCLTSEETNSADLVRSVVESVKVPDSSLSISHERETLTSLMDTSLYLANMPVADKVDQADLLQRLKINCTYDEALYAALEQGISPTLNDDENKRVVLSIRQYLTDAFKEQEVIETVKKAANGLIFDRHKIKNLKLYLQELVSKVEPHLIENDRKDPAIVDEVNFEDVGKLTSVCQAIQEIVSGESGFKTGWQDLNDMMQGTLLRGECVGIQALQHNYKTGFSLTLFKQIAIYNKPEIIPGKKPLLLRISTEDSLNSNIQFLFQNLKENEEGATPDLTKYTPIEMANYVKSCLEANGWHIKMIRINPSEYSIRSIQNEVIALESMGYEVQLLMIDYLPMIPTIGCEQGPAGHDYRDMLRKMRNFCSSRRILFITPWQMSTDAKMLLREGRTEFLKQIVGKGYYSGTKQADQEFDAEIAIHIEEFNGRSFLTVARGKHRRPTTIPEYMKYFVLPFPEKGSIPDDLNKQRIGRRKIGGGTIGSGEENPFFEFDAA
jgi:hypothetical protein